jgi:hypothetical protein
LLSDDFQDPAKGVLPKEPSPGVQVELGYDKGEYFVRKPLGVPGFKLVWPRGVFDDASVAVDTRLVGDAANRYVFVQCRMEPDSGATGYMLSVTPSAGGFNFVKFEGGQSVPLGARGQQTSPAIKRGNATNRLELSCAGSTITATVNGTQIATAQDAAYKSGNVRLGVGAFSPDTALAEARFANFVVTKR